jgi:hypothetical protein
MPEGGNVLSRNPNVRGSCSSIDDGVGESNVPELAGADSEHPTSVNPEKDTVIKAEVGPGIHEAPVDAFC